MSSARIVAPRASACRSSSRTRTPDPSATTKPSRPASNGREARSGSSFRVERARIAANPPTSGSKMPASVPPASMMSASARRMISLDSPMAWPPVAQADTVAKFGPVIPKLIATWPAPTLGMPIGMRNGLIRSGPRRALIEMPSTRVPTPPRPVPRTTPGPLGELALEAFRQAGLVERLAGGDEPELDVAVRPALVLAVEDAARIEVDDLAGDPRGQAARIERRDRPDAGAAGDEARPRWRRRRCRGP